MLWNLPEMKLNSVPLWKHLWSLGWRPQTHDFLAWLSSISNWPAKPALYLDLWLPRACCLPKHSLPRVSPSLSPTRPSISVYHLSFITFNWSKHLPKHIVLVDAKRMHARHKMVASPASRGSTQICDWTCTIPTISLQSFSRVFLYINSSIKAL